MILVLLMAMLPQSMELRYYLAVLYLTVLAALRSPNLFLSRIALATVLLAMIFSMISVFIGAPAPSMVLTTPQRCYELGTLKFDANHVTGVLLLSKQKVSNNLPFQCRLSMDSSIVIDYSDCWNQSLCPY